MKKLLHEANMIFCMFFNVIAFISGCLIIFACQCEMLLGTLSKKILNQESNLILCSLCFFYMIVTILILISTATEIRRLANDHKNFYENDVWANTLPSRFVESSIRLLCLAMPIIFSVLISSGKNDLLHFLINLIFIFGGFVYIIYKINKLLRSYEMAP